MYLIGLTGGIAAGKTVVAARLEELGAVRVDADKLAREVVEPGTPALAAIADHFGSQILMPDGTLDRAALGSIIFADEAERLALNGITHPAIQDLTSQRFAGAEADDPAAIVVYDVPLLTENSSVADYHRFDVIVVVQARADIRIARLVELRGLSIAEAERRINSQATDEERLAIADVVIDSNGSLEHTLTQVDAFWATIPTR